MIEFPKGPPISWPATLPDHNGATPDGRKLGVPDVSVSAPGFVQKDKVMRQLTVSSNADAAFIEKYGAAEPARQAQAVKEVLAQIADRLPVEVPRGPGVLKMFPGAETLKVREALLRTPVQIHHKVDPDNGIHTHVFLGYGPEDDGDYKGQAGGATQPFHPVDNPHGIKFNMTHKFAQACDLLLHFQQLQRQGMRQLGGVDVAQAVEGMTNFIAAVVRHELIHCEQYRIEAVMDIDHDFDANSIAGLPSDALIAAGRAEATYEAEAFSDEERYLHSIKAAEGLKSAEGLRKHLQDTSPSSKMFKSGGAFEFLADGLDNEFGSYYLLYMAESAELFEPEKPFAFTGTLKLFMNGMHEPAEAFRALRKANDHLEEVLTQGASSGPTAAAFLGEVTASSQKWAEYFDQGDATRRMQNARPHLFKLEKGFEAEMERSRSLAQKAAQDGRFESSEASAITGQWRDHLG